ncbi:hypothetical protein PHMEG_00028502 [Phytophthora megakarya]|uniref:MULE transposase domain-containing protein n=1 Tax=Phytophthora megakarya TaxID=4795 RepID=A0A225V610_9STRA|nr:hypothetical protein PHMEG_00028502 [Phytophthora megakarya]
MFASVRLIFGIDLNLLFGSLDRSSGIANAYLEVWPKINLLNCYPHFSRKCRENRARLVKREFYETNREDESGYADWLEQIYLGNLWGNWFYTAATPGLPPSPNALKSHHTVIKETCIVLLRASTSVVLNDALPRTLKHQEQQPVKF